MNRYSRQKEMVSQEKLKNSTVLVAGAGGLGGFSSLLLAMAGVGRIVLIDNDVVEESNLNRQVLYREEDIGKSKIEVATRRLKEINDDIEVIGVKAEIATGMSIPDNFDIVVDGLDNLEARYIIENIALENNVPYVFGAVEGYMGMVTFIDSSTKKLRDFLPEFTIKKIQVLGATASLVASLQAQEVIKYINGGGKLLRNRLLIYDALSTNFLEVRL